MKKYQLSCFIERRQHCGKSLRQTQTTAHMHAYSHPPSPPFLGKLMFSHSSKPDSNQGGKFGCTLWSSPWEGELTVPGIMPRSSVGVCCSPGDFTQWADSWEMGKHICAHMQGSKHACTQTQLSLKKECECEQNLGKHLRHDNVQEVAKFIISPEKHRNMF